MNNIQYLLAEPGPRMWGSRRNQGTKKPGTDPGSRRERKTLSLLAERPTIDCPIGGQ